MKENASINGNKNNSDIVKGISTAIALLTGSFYLYINPDFFGYQLVTNIIGAIIGVIGVLGFIIEAGKMNENLKPYIRELGALFLIIVIIIVLNIIFSNVIINAIIFILFLTCVYAMSNFVINVSILISNEKRTFKKVLIKSPIVILNSLIFVLTVMQILQIINILE
ncbi:hypothetical protein BN988_01615 [Oceanobacillus picturae]|uniref:Uncharacterized protein n=1 Tax=Oceanobacillus picturae TaxID=171693 RepID=W9B9D9_9BACI|nr:hypothetical protein [Oceanobacillus picturae]CDO03115.1 hypothetical protein BN988_01615 [Oceanobacillus picturae]